MKTFLEGKGPGEGGAAIDSRPKMLDNLRKSETINSYSYDKAMARQGRTHIAANPIFPISQI